MLNAIDEVYFSLYIGSISFDIKGEAILTILSCLIQGFLSLFSFIRFTQMSTANPLSFIVFVVLVYLYYQFTKNQVACRISPADKACSLTISILFSGLALFSQKDMLLLNSTNLIEQIAIMVLSGIGLALILFYFLKLNLNLLFKKIKKNENVKIIYLNSTFFSFFML